MESLSFSTWVIICLLIVSILNVILFFKIWFMTNDIRAIRNKFVDYKKPEFEMDFDQLWPGLALLGVIGLFILFIWLIY